MPTQFETLVQKLDQIIAILEDMAFPPQYLDLSAEVPDDHGVGEVPVDNQAPRTYLVYKDLNGEDKRISPNDLERKVVEVIEIAQSMNAPYQLYQTEDDRIRLMVDNSVLTEWDRRNPGMEGGTGR